MRNAPSITIVEQLHKDGATVRAYDPEAQETARAVLGDKVEYVSSKEEALKGADALVIVTDWDEFKTPNWNEVKSSLKNPIIIDGRNMFDPKEMKDLGFTYKSVGRG
jgi:UDPglucose 6-dehydrogenase